jgi:putative SOS response-associated peptidase YedK
LISTLETICHNPSMCGRYRLSRKKELREHFDAYGEYDDIARYNIAPSQPVLAIRREPSTQRRSFSSMRWGLIPSWAKDSTIGSRTINARSETVTTMPSVRDPFKSQRCLIPADGFYEWARNGKSKQPYCFEVGDGEIFAFAGLWDRWADPRGEVVESCTILTTTPNALLADIHDRMPAILRPADYDLWLNPTPEHTEGALRLLSPYTDLMRRYPVSTRVNQVQNDDADCAKPVELEVPAQSQLFS